MELNESITLDEAIKHSNDKAKELFCKADEDFYFDGNWNKRVDCLECAKQHKQLAEWLTILKEIKEAYESEYQVQDVIEVCVKYWG